jgi:hypothetical protein
MSTSQRGGNQLPALGRPFDLHYVTRMLFPIEISIAFPNAVTILVQKNGCKLLCSIVTIAGATSYRIPG